MKTVQVQLSLLQQPLFQEMCSNQVSIPPLLLEHTHCVGSSNRMLMTCIYPCECGLVCKYVWAHTHISDRQSGGSERVMTSALWRGILRYDFHQSHVLLEKLSGTYNTGFLKTCTLCLPCIFSLLEPSKQTDHTRSGYLENKAWFVHRPS